MYIKLKKHEGGSWRVIEIDECEWDTTRQSIKAGDLPHSSRPFMSPDYPPEFMNIYIRRKGEDHDTHIYCNTQAYLLNDNGETIEKLICQL